MITAVRLHPSSRCDIALVVSHIIASQKPHPRSGTHWLTPAALQRLDSARSQRQRGSSAAPDGFSLDDEAAGVSKSGGARPSPFASNDAAFMETSSLPVPGLDLRRVSSKPTLAKQQSGFVKLPSYHSLRTVSPYSLAFLTSSSGGSPVAPWRSVAEQMADCHLSTRLQRKVSAVHVLQATNLPGGKHSLNNASSPAGSTRGDHPASPARLAGRQAAHHGPVSAAVRARAHLHAHAESEVLLRVSLSERSRVVVTITFPQPSVKTRRLAWVLDGRGARGSSSAACTPPMKATSCGRPPVSARSKASQWA